MNKLKFSKLNKKIVYILLACGVVFAALQCFMVMNLYEADVYLYAHGTVLPTVFNVVLSLFVIGVLVYFSLCTCGEYSDKLAETSFVSRIFSLLAAASLLYTGVTEFIGYNQNAAGLMYMEQKQDKFIFWSSVISFGAFIYFLVFAFVPDKLNKLKTFLGCITVVWHILYLLSVYFDMTSPLNDPMRLMNEFALVGIMMYLTVEIRYLCGIPKKGFYIGASVVAFTLLLSSSVSNLIFAFGGGTVQGGNISVYIYQLCAAGYILSRVISQIKTEE
ncbi:MAG: hypothetical protein IKU19_06445 [Clostridia bacterium]|nr:hypothetical protein [Clostridia bacterium]